MHLCDLVYLRLNFEKEPKQRIMAAILRFAFVPGLLLAGTLSLFYLATWYFSPEAYIDKKFSMTFIVICISFAIVFAARYAKTKTGGIGYFETWGVIISILAIGTMLYYGSEMLLYNVIDPGMPEFVEEVQKADFKEALAAGAIDQTTFDEYWPEFEAIDSTYTPKWVLLRGLQYLVIWAMVSFILAFFIFGRERARGNN